MLYHEKKYAEYINLYCLHNHNRTWEAEGCLVQFYHTWDNISLFLNQYVTDWCLMLGPATLGHYLNVLPFASAWAWNSKANDYLKYDKTGLYTLLLLRLPNRLFSEKCWQMAQGAIYCSLCGNLNVAMGQNSGLQEKQIAFRSIGKG